MNRRKRLKKPAVKYLFDEWEVLSERFRSRRIFLFLDYDGTLTPITGKPGQAVLSGGVRKVLQRLAEKPAYRLAVISGRAIADIKKIVGIAGIVYAGNHGLEIEGPELKHHIFLHPRYRRILMEAGDTLENAVAGIKGAFVEDKGLSLSVHYRLVEPEKIPGLLTNLRRALSGYVSRNEVKVKKGKMIIEVNPPVAWDKGKSVLWLIARWKAAAGDRNTLPVYLGDDRTDEDAFRAIGNKGVTVFVGNPASADTRARYYLRGTPEVTEFLKKITELKEIGGG